MGYLTDTSKGLEVEVEMPPTIRRSAEALELAKMGVLSFSIGYNVKRARKGANGARHLEGLDLAEVSFVTFPANPEARILSAKEAAEEAETVKALEELIADVRRYGEEFRRRRRSP